jgi:hypothetical protein
MKIGSILKLHPLPEKFISDQEQESDSCHMSTVDYIEVKSDLKDTNMLEPKSLDGVSNNWKNKK